MTAENSKKGLVVGLEKKVASMEKLVKFFNRKDESKSLLFDLCIVSFHCGE